MPRYFLEVAYKGTNYSGFQSQHNANTIQAEIEKAFSDTPERKNDHDRFIPDGCRCTCFAEFFSF